MKAFTGNFACILPDPYETSDVMFCIIYDIVAIIICVVIGVVGVLQKEKLETIA